MNPHLFFARPFKIVFQLSILILVSFASTNGLSQQSNNDGERRERYVNSSPEQKPIANKLFGSGKIVLLPKTEYVIEPDDYEIEKRAFDLINKERMKKGMEPLGWDGQIAALARAHSQSMARHDFFSHAGFNGQMVDERAIESGATDWEAIGENIAFCHGFSNPVEFVVTRWMLSVVHRDNLLNPMWSHAGIGMAKTKEGKHYFTQVFVVKS